MGKAFLAADLAKELRLGVGVERVVGSDVERNARSVLAVELVWPRWGLAMIL